MRRTLPLCLLVLLGFAAAARAQTEAGGRNSWGPYTVTGNGSYPNAEGIVTDQWDSACTMAVDVTGTISVQLESKAVGGTWIAQGSACSSDCEVALTGPRDRLRITASRCTGCSGTTAGLTCRRDGER